MTSKTEETIDALGSMRLPELQARYLEVTGTATRCPNRNYLIRKISEALTLKKGKASSSSSSRSYKPKPVRADDEGSICETHESVAELIDNVEVTRADTHPVDDAVGPLSSVPPQANSGEGSTAFEATVVEQDSGAVEAHARTRRRSMTVDELRARYLEVVGRHTSSVSVSYLAWKIREAEKGRVRVGPAEKRRVAGTAVDVKVLPLRIETPTLERIDSVWRTQGLRSRMEFFRRAVAHYLEALTSAHCSNVIDAH